MTFSTADLNQNPSCSYILPDWDPYLYAQSNQYQHNSTSYIRKPIKGLAQILFIFVGPKCLTTPLQHPPRLTNPPKLGIIVWK